MLGNAHAGRSPGPSPIDACRQIVCAEGYQTGHFLFYLRAPADVLVTGGGHVGDPKPRRS